MSDTAITSHPYSLRRLITALAVAYLLVLQAFLGGAASGAHAGVMLDTFGQVLCRGMGGNEEKGARSSGDDLHHTPDCCITGCQTSTGAGLPPPAGFSAAMPFVLLSGTATASVIEAVLHDTERTPRHTRAPPLA